MTSRPLRIGISSCFFHADPERPVFKGKTLLYVEESMLDLVGRAGALALMIPRPVPAGPSVSDYVDLLDGLLLEGGSDVCPRTYGEEPQRPQWEGDEIRDRYEIELVHSFHDAGKPVLGICRGIQILNVAFGGTLYQDITTQVPGSSDHRNWDIYDANRHEIDLRAGSRLASLYPGAERVTVNSVHHQAVKDLADGFEVEAVSVGDGIIEAVRLPGERFVAAVQWHPEFTPPGATDQIPAEPVIDDFLAAASFAATGVQVGSVKVVNPATGQHLTNVLDDSPELIAERVAAARVAQPLWAARPIAERIDILHAFRGWVVKKTDELAATLTSETGKPIGQSRNELAGLLPRIDFFLDHAEAVLADEVVLDDAAPGGTREVITHEPLGVIANISAWNYPYFVGSNVFVPALLAGNAVLYKPSEHATLTGLAIASMLNDAGVPVDVFSVVAGDGAVGAELLSHPLDGVFFTGSYATGRRIAESVASQLGRVQLELGGKDPVYVCDDVDVALAAEGLADGAFYNNGQSCCSVERIYVHESVHDEFVERFVATVEGFAMGDPTDEATYLGPLTRPDQADVLEAQVADAVAAGATVRTGGARVAGTPEGTAWFAATVLTGVTTDMAVMRDESFGPIIGIQAVAGDGEALARMNDTTYGLTAGVYAVDEARATAILRQVDAGSAYWNCCDRVSPRLPWSGRGHSGVGSTLAASGILTFARPKAWHLRSPV